MNLTHLLAQQQQPGADEAVAIAAIMMAVFIVLLVMIAINVLICFLLYTCQSKVPQEHRKIQPGLIFLLLIPLFNLIWNFFVFLQIPESFKSFFDAHGKTDVGDCGRTIGMAYSICVLLGIVPCVNWIAGPAALVLLIIFLLKAFELKKLVESMQSGGGTPASAAPPAAPPPAT